MVTVAMKLGSPNIIHDHVPDFLGAAFHAQQVTGKAGGQNFWNTLVFSDDKHHFPGGSAERDAIFERNHSFYSLASDRHAQND